MCTAVLMAITLGAGLLAGCSTEKVTVPGLTAAQLSRFTHELDQATRPSSAPRYQRTGACFLLTATQLEGLPHPTAKWTADGAIAVVDGRGDDQCAISAQGPPGADVGGLGIIDLQQGSIRKPLKNDRILRLSGTGWQFAYLAYPGDQKPTKAEAEAVLNEVVENVRHPSTSGFSTDCTLFNNDVPGPAVTYPDAPCSGIPVLTP